MPSYAIAVAGLPGAGTSFVAWNLAVVMGLTLLEGVKTGSLSTWTGDSTTVQQALDETLPLGTVVDDDYSIDSIMARRVIVDCGADRLHSIFVRAKTRIWVTRLDPVQPPIPARALVVVNRVPQNLPFDVREVVKTKIALTIPDGGLDVVLSMFTHRAWITSQDREIQEKWKSLVSTKGDGDKWDSIG
nr:hypothetical protein [Bacilli bacterium]